MKSAFVKFFLSSSETSPPNLSISFMISAFLNLFHQLAGRWLASGLSGSGFFLFRVLLELVSTSFFTFGLAIDFTAVALFVALASSFTSFASVATGLTPL